MRVTAWSACVLLALTPGVELAAHGRGVGDPRVLSAWDQAVLAGLLVLGTTYARGAWHLRRVRASAPILEHVAFATGWVALAASVSPWMDRAAIARFSAHMAQHELMMLVGAPLLIAGRPLATCLWALPVRWRRRSAAVLQQGIVAGASRFLTTPATAWALHGGAVWIWHAPVLYEAAVRSEGTHALQHAIFVVTSMLFWFGLLQGRYGRAGYGAAVFYVFTTAVHTGILGALFALSRTPLYAVYAGDAGVSATAAEADQQLAGLVMWIPAGILLTLAGVGFFAAWLGESERRGRRLRTGSDVSR
jgi:putative membrane protein